MNNLPPARSGFTLIEVLIVVVLLGILTVAGAMNYIRLRERHALENIAERIASEIKSAKTTAVNGTDSSLDINVAAGTITRNPGGRAINLPANIAITGSSTISFSGNVINRGRFTGTPNPVILESNTFRIEITLDAQGNPTLGRPNPL